jgi:protein-tyrosine kinase
MEIKAVSLATSGSVDEHEERLIGAILLREKRITDEQAQRILRLQREQGLRFGEAGIRLGFLTEADIEFALARQFNSPYLQAGESTISRKVFAAFAASGVETESIRALRGQLMMRWFDTDPSHRALAVISGERSEGRSFIVSNLAVVFCLLGRRTLLIDADLRHPTQHSLFGLGNRSGLSAILSGRGGEEAIERVPGLQDLSILPAGIVPPNPIELLSQPLFSKLLKELGREYEFILIDSPAAADYADAQTIAVRAGGALIVARKNSTRMWKVRGVSDSVVDTSATVVGTVLNEF